MAMTWRVWMVLGLVGCAVSEESGGPYVTPIPLGEKAPFLETFDSNFRDRWVESGKEKYDGVWSWSDEISSFPGDRGLFADEGGRHYGVGVKFDEPISCTNSEFEVKFRHRVGCQGAYVKLLPASPDLDMNDFDNETPYIIMFGPDKCDKDRVHFIFKHKSPITGIWEEKHLQGPPPIKNDEGTHLYSLRVKPDNSFQVYIDGESTKKGNLLNDIYPPVEPPKEVDDPDDSMPDDWVTEAEIPDPHVAKPSDWDEDAPAHIVDEEDEMPSGWLVDVPRFVPDPDASKPDGWDDEEDGEWIAPSIENPRCKDAGVPGCGEWKPRMIPNPAFKGKWSPPKIPNPEYKGVWTPRKIPNVDYFEDKHPHNFPDLGGLGIEIWCLEGGIMFDNFIVTHSWSQAKSFADATFSAKLLAEPQPDQDKKNIIRKGVEWVANQDKAMQISIAVGFMSLVLCGVVMCRPRRRPAPDSLPSGSSSAPVGGDDGDRDGKGEGDSCEGADKDEDEDEVKEGDDAANSDLSSVGRKLS